MYKTTEKQQTLRLKYLKIITEQYNKGVLNKKQFKKERKSIR
jgi:hypothetical protein